MRQDFRHFFIFEPTKEEKERILMALETVQIIKQGYYTKEKSQIPLSNRKRNFSQVTPYPPKILENLRLTQKAVTPGSLCKIQVFACDMLEAAMGLTAPLVLNFADSLTPGGRFLYGAATQEESLCRASTLYASLTSEKAAEMYWYNKDHSSPVDSDYLLLSPEVCVFRDAKGRLLDTPYSLSVISMAAPDRSSRAAGVPQEELDRVIKRRLHNLFTVAAFHGYHSLVLGAWGCGAFENDAHHVAGRFYELLITDGYAKWFDTVLFAILHDSAKLDIFREHFENNR